MKRICGKFLASIPLLLLLAFLVLPWHNFLHAQGSSGFTKIASAITPTTYTDSTVADGNAYEYQVTAVNAAGAESIPGTFTTTSSFCTGSGTNTAICLVPATGTHSVLLNWTAGTNSTGANVYRFLVPAPGAPTGLSAVGQ